MAWRQKPRSFTIGGVHTAFDYSLSGQGKLGITRGFIGIGSQLKWPDDYFASNTTLNIEKIALDNFRSGGFAISKGTFNNFSIRQTFTRSNISDPLFPRRGSRMTLSLQVTPPYSLFRKKFLKSQRHKKKKYVGNLHLKTDLRVRCLKQM